MADTPLQPLHYLSPNVLTRQLLDPQTRLTAHAEPYVPMQMAGQAEGTVDVKPRDLTCVLSFSVQPYGHDDRRERDAPEPGADVHGPRWSLSGTCREGGVRWLCPRYSRAIV